MKVSKKMLHKDLQPFYFRFKLMTRILSLRPMVSLMNFLLDRFLSGRDIEGLQCSEARVPGRGEEAPVRVRIYRPENQQGPLPLLLYIHGGGYITGVPEMAADCIKKFIETRPCVVIAPDYRKALTNPFPAGFDDCYNTLLWATREAETLGVVSDKVMVAGHSAGGGLTAAVTLKARNTGDVDIAFQMPIYPMIDDQQPDDPERAIDAPGWNTTTNRFGWNCYLAGLQSHGGDIPSYAAPARNKDYSGFPPTITFVGDLEPFFWETEAYVKALRETGVEVAYKLFKGCFHGFDIVASESAIGQQALEYTFQSFAAFYDRYVSDAP